MFIMDAIVLGNLGGRTDIDTRNIPRRFKTGCQRAQSCHL